MEPPPRSARGAVRIRQENSEKVAKQKINPSKINPTMPKILGNGTFGTVAKVDGDAVKSFKKLHALVNEVFVTRYVSGSPYFIKIKKYDLNSLTMTMDLWHTSLDQALKMGVSREKRQMLHICILRGKAYLESRYILHADLKLQNILVNSDSTKAVIADFGVSSASNSAKVECTPNIASPLETFSHRSHDAFGLVVITLQLMYGYQPRKRANTRAELRSIVRDVVNNKDHANSICKLIH